MANEEQRIEILNMIAENYGVTMSDRIMFMWLGLLADYDFRDIQKAAMNLIRHSGNDQVAYKTMPPFALMQRELDKVCGAITDPEEKLTLLAETAWNGLLTAINRYGSYRMPEDLDDTTLYCLRSMGGWQVVCNWRESELNWRKKEFLELFALADGKVEMLESGPEAIEALSPPSIGPTTTKDALGGFMQSLKARNAKAIAING